MSTFIRSNLVPMGAMLLALSLPTTATAQGDSSAVPEGKSTADADVSSARPRVFVAKLRAGSGASEGEASLLNDSFLVAIKEFDSEFEIRTSQDIEGIAELEAAQTLSGCDVVSCAAEIGDALGAEQLVTGQLGRVGSTWILSLTRTDRSTLKALSRTQVRAQGKAPDVLFPLIADQAAETFGRAAVAPEVESTGGGLSVPILVGGGAVFGTAVVVLGLSALSYGLSYNRYDAAVAATKKSDFDVAVGVGKVAYWGSVAGAVIGSVLVVAGAAGIGAAFVVGGEE